MEEGERGGGVFSRRMSSREGGEEDAWRGSGEGKRGERGKEGKGGEGVFSRRLSSSDRFF